MPATPQDRLYGLTTSVAVKPPVFISADYDVARFGEQTITSSTPTGDRTVTTTEGMRILLMGQDNPVENGIWVARRSFWVRATDFNGPRDAVNGTLVFSITGDCWQVEAVVPVVIGLSDIHFRPTYPFEANLDIFQRTLRVPEASVSVLPSAEDRAWKGLGFDGAGQPKLQDPAGTGLWGYVPAIGSFEKGSLLTQRFEVLLWESTDEYWRWDGAMPKIVLPGSTPDTAGGRGKGKWLDVTDATLRANLGSGEEGFGDAIVQHNKNFSVREMLNRIRTLADNDAPLPYLGYDPVNDAALYNAMGEASDRHLLLNGGLHIAGDCANGIRRNAGLFSVRGGQEDSGQGFNVPLMGVSNARGLRGYEIYELVSSYTDVTTPERQSYHNVATATYTATTVTIDPTTYAETLAKLKVGHYIRTMHPTYCVGLVTAINAETGVITVDEWADSGTTTTTPASGVGLYTRYITKAYAQNINLFITANSDVTNATGVELGMSAHKLVSGTVAGLDIPVLSSSTQNMTVGLLVRHATTNNTGLDFGVRASDARVNFHSDGTDGTGRTVRVGFNESSNAITGFRGNGKNTSYLMLASTVADVTDTSLENSPMILGPYGQDYRKYDRAITISSDATLNGYFPNITLTAAGITITMPPAAAHRNGHKYYFNLRAIGTYHFTGDVTVEGVATYNTTTTVVRKEIKIQYDGTQWLVSNDK
ncbi:hypothetical protein ACP97I_16610 [Raoultella ornithinolytica]|uniref:tail fiber/spike domain-containing protein n=1 Tax=Raoultella ornithinolytica TaxID=54291 RepID=UPI003D968C01